MSESRQDLTQRLSRAVARLEELRDRPGQGRYEKVRLDGKIDGVKLAASYLEEGTRIFSPTAEAAADDLTKVIAQALRESKALQSAMAFGVPFEAYGTCREAIADDIAPLIEARVREARAEAWDETAEKAYGWGWLHDWALADVKGRNPYREDEDNA